MRLSHAQGGTGDDRARSCKSCPAASDWRTPSTDSTAVLRRLAVNAAHLHVRLGLKRIGTSPKRTRNSGKRIGNAAQQIGASAKRNGNSVRQIRNSCQRIGNSPKQIVASAKRVRGTDGRWVALTGRSVAGTGRLEHRLDKALREPNKAILPSQEVIRRWDWITRRQCVDKLRADVSAVMSSP